MSRRVLSRLAPLTLVLALGLAACGDGGDDEPAATQGSSSPSESTSDSASADGDAVAVTVTREGDTFTPNGERVELEVGQTLDLTITSDAAGEFHVHSTPEQEIAYDAGTSEHQITIDRPGVVEVESHEPASIVLQLEVR
ncbi:hypothetical protein ASC64_12425 [Nocardioides sp. Root122]|uniref:hypothetical protein n=1 Tax=Nocardioides TaxID=1839 RepID=UPI0007032BEB|nr:MULTISPECIES: hypothetical protein [Nocardioides]KQV65716.1 hypothetical protein ASC64_12425 [Nocardioides sp. Root122]MCK9825629.1 hypothetical protein [Nocardioides cavernae]